MASLWDPLLVRILPRLPICQSPPCGVGYTFSLFLPTIITGLGFSATTAQLFFVPPNAAGCIATIIAGVLSDRVHARGLFILVALAAYATLFATTNPWADAGTILAAWGLFP